MKNRLLLTPLQSAAWRSAKRESILSEDKCAALREEIAVLEECHTQEGRRGAARYKETLTLILADHGIESVPADLGLVSTPEQSEEGLIVFGFETEHATAHTLATKEA